MITCCYGPNRKNTGRSDWEEYSKSHGIRRNGKNMEKKKICFIAQFPPPIHGLSKAVETLFNSELSQEYDFEKINITHNKKIFKNLFAIGRSKADLFYFTISQSKGGNLRDLVILKLLELRHKRCLIHLHGGYYRTLVEEKLPKWQRDMNYSAIGNIEGIIVLGKSLEWIFKGMISDDKIHIVPNCIDNEYLLSDQEFEKKNRISESGQEKHVLYLSNFIKSKGYPEILEMAVMEKTRCEAGGKKQLHFDFAGKFFKKEDEEFFWQYIKEQHIQDYITYHGVVEGYKKRELLKNCEIFVLLTRYPNEGQPISILEAMGNGMAVVTTNHGGIPDLVENGVNGIVVDKKVKIPVADIYKQLSSLNVLETGKRNWLDVTMKFTESNYLRNMKEKFDLILK